MRVSDLTLDQLHAAVLSLTLERKYYLDLAFGVNEQYYKNKACDLYCVIQALNAEIDVKLGCISSVADSDDEPFVEDCSH